MRVVLPQGAKNSVKKFSSQHEIFMKIPVPNEGMPITKTPNLRGNLITEFGIKFPQSMPSDRFPEVSRLLGDLKYS
jgi:hypothetical protein